MIFAPVPPTVDTCGNPDAEVTHLISRLFIGCTERVKEQIAAKLDDQAKEIAALRTQLAESGFQVIPR